MPTQRVMDHVAEISALLGCGPSGHWTGDNPHTHGTDWSLDIPVVHYTTDESRPFAHRGERFFLVAVVRAIYTDTGNDLSIEIDMPLADPQDLVRLYTLIGYCATSGIPWSIDGRE